MQALQTGDLNPPLPLWNYCYAQTFSNNLNECNSRGQRRTIIILEVDDTDGQISDI